MISLETIQAYLEEQRARVEEELERLLPPESCLAETKRGFAASGARSR